MDVTGVRSADFGHRSAIPKAVETLWDMRRKTRRARHCSRSYSADTDHPDSPPTGEGVRRCHVSFREERSSHTVGVPVLPLLSEVRDLHVSPGPSSEHACTPTRGPGPSRAITAAGTLQDERRNPHRTKDEIQDDSDARRLPTVYFLQCPTTVPHDSGEDGDFHAPLMYAAPPCDYKRRRRAPLRSLWTLVCLVSPASLFKRTYRDY